MPSARHPELALLDRLFGIEGAEGRSESRELRDHKVIQGDIVAEFGDKAGHEKYLVETEVDTYVAILKKPGAEFPTEDTIEATRTGSAYESTAVRDYGL